MTLRTSCAVLVTRLSRVLQSASVLALLLAFSGNAKAATIDATHEIILNFDFSSQNFPGPYAGLLTFIGGTISSAGTLNSSSFDSSNTATGGSFGFFNTGPLQVNGSIDFLLVPTVSDPTGHVVFAAPSTLVWDINLVFLRLEDTSGHVSAFLEFEGDQLVATPTSTVPLPATLPLFATGLGALGLLAWRRKWKAAA